MSTTRVAGITRPAKKVEDPMDEILRLIDDLKKSTISRTSETRKQLAGMHETAKKLNAELRKRQKNATNNTGEAKERASSGEKQGARRRGERRK
ncbi:hypothetical protein PM082_018964 [Marasmius tenuissimus]|nr:hypothetical protein PM082_018964 [Marasmius tenuissimus]